MVLNFVKFTNFNFKVGSGPIFEIAYPSIFGEKGFQSFDYFKDYKSFTPSIVSIFSKLVNFEK